jgi:hypothetical protein
VTELENAYYTGVRRRASEPAGDVERESESMQNRPDQTGM